MVGRWGYGFGSDTPGGGYTRVGEPVGWIFSTRASNFQEGKVPAQVFSVADDSHACYHLSDAFTTCRSRRSVH